MSVIETQVRIENGGYVRADRLNCGDAILTGDRVATVRDAEFDHWVGGVRMVKLWLRCFGVEDEYDGDPVFTMVVPVHHGFARLEVRSY